MSTVIGTFLGDSESCPTLVQENYNVKIPTRATSGSVGYDLYASKDVCLPPLFVGKIPTGIFLDIPPDIYATIDGRSGNTFRGRPVMRGIVDSDYRGELGVLILNLNREEVVVQAGDCIAQLVFHKKVDILFKMVGSKDELSKTERGENGFGSTDRR